MLAQNVRRRHRRRCNGSRQSILRTTRSVNASWDIYVKSLETGEELALDADRQMDTMGTIKIPLMVEAFEQIKVGKLAHRQIHARAADRSPARRSCARSRRADDGEGLVTLMIIVSDNTATEVLYRMVGGPDAVNARMQAIGLKKTRATTAVALVPGAARRADTEQFHREGKNPYGLSTPREMGRLLERMERGTLVDKASSDLMLQIMRGQLYRTRIPRYVTATRSRTRPATSSPTSETMSAMLEAPGKTIVVSVFTGNHFGSGEMLENAIGLVAKEVADYFILTSKIGWNIPPSPSCNRHRILVR